MKEGREFPRPVSASLTSSFWIRRRKMVFLFIEPENLSGNFRPLKDREIPRKCGGIGASYRKLYSQQDRRLIFPSICYLAQGCCLRFRSLSREWKFLEEEVMNGYVFWVPRVLEMSLSRTPREQQEILDETRTTLRLPRHHLTGFGSVVQIACLMLAYKAAGEQPGILRTVRTGTFVSGRGRVHLTWRHNRLHCLFIDQTGGGESRSENVGVFAQGVEPR